MNNGEFTRIMMFLVVLWLFIMCIPKLVHAESYAYGEISIHHNINSQGWVGDTPSGIAAGLHHDFDKNWYGEIEIRHQSNIDRGVPFNDKYETWVDSVGITIGRKFKW
jgi:hypothetical protein